MLARRVVEGMQNILAANWSSNTSLSGCLTSNLLWDFLVKKNYDFCSGSSGCEAESLWSSFFFYLNLYFALAYYASFFKTISLMHGSLLSILFRNESVWFLFLVAFRILRRLLYMRRVNRRTKNVFCIFIIFEIRVSGLINYKKAIVIWNANLFWLLHSRFLCG